MVSGDHTALERMPFVESVDAASLKVWEATIAAHEHGINLLKSRVSCADVAYAINDVFAKGDLSQFRAFGFGHSVGVLSHCYGHKAGLELR